jgi:hypothetical protein
MKMLQRFLRLLVIGGLPPALFVTLAVHFERSLHVVEGVATTLTSATIIAGALTAVAHAYATYVRRRGATVGFFLVIMPIVGGFAAATAYVDASRPRPRWHALAAPPEPIADLAGPDCYSGMPLLYARAKTGKIYQISTRPGKAWRIASDVPRHRPNHFGDCSPQDNTEMLRSSKAPGRVVDSHWITIQGVGCGGHARHVLLDDGSIWQWSTYRCTGCVSPALAFFPLVTLVFTFLAAMFIAFSKSSLGWPRRSSARADIP